VPLQYKIKLEYTVEPTNPLGNEGARKPEVSVTLKLSIFTIIVVFPILYDSNR